MQVKVNSEVIFDECQDCGKELNEMEVEYCENKYSNTRQIVALCSTCLDKEYEGSWPTLNN